MKDYKSIFEANGFDFDAKLYNDYTVAIGISLIKEYEENSYLFNRNSFQLILDLAKGINNGIQGLKKLSEEWEGIIHSRWWASTRRLSGTLPTVAWTWWCKPTTTSISSSSS